MDWSIYFYYDESSPSKLRRNTDCMCGKNNNVKKHSIGDVAGNFSSSHRYWSVTAAGKQYLAHRVIWEIFNNEIPDKMQIDHIDGDRGNNNLENLRLVSKSQNMRNVKKATRNKSGQIGVYTKGQFSKGGIYHSYWVACWKSMDGKAKEKHFPIHKLGNEEAFRLACEYRKKMIEELNALGAGYTERHGT